MEQNTRKPRKTRQIKQLGKRQVFHFRCEAARRQCDVAHHALRNSELVTEAVQRNEIDKELVQAVTVKGIGVVYDVPPPRQVKPPQQVRMVVGRKLDPSEWLIHLSAMIEIAKGNGWRQPSAKAKNWQSTSAIMKASQAAGLSDGNTFERSERGNKKLQARKESNALIVLDQLIERHPDRAGKASSDERMLNWFVAAVEQHHDIDREWLRIEAKTRLSGRHHKFLHSSEKARRENIRQMPEAA